MTTSRRSCSFYTQRKLCIQETQKYTNNARKHTTRHAELFFMICFISMMELNVNYLIALQSRCTRLKQWSKTLLKQQTSMIRPGEVSFNASTQKGVAGHNKWSFWIFEWWISIEGSTECTVCKSSKHKQKKF